MLNQVFLVFDKVVSCLRKIQMSDASLEDYPKSTYLHSSIDERSSPYFIKGILPPHYNQ